MSVDSPAPDSKKNPPANTADSSAPKHDAPAPGADHVKNDVATGKLACPEKLKADAAPTVTQPWKPGQTADPTSPLVIDNIYSSTTSTGGVFGVKTPTLDLAANPASAPAGDLLAKTTAGNELDDKLCTIDDYKSAFDLSSLTTGAKGKDLNALNSWKNNLYTSYASNMWTDDFQKTLSTKADSALKTAFDEKDDAAKLAGYKPTGLDSATQTALASHKNGEAWVDGANKFYKTDNGALVERSKDGIHYIGPDGLRYDGSHGEGRLTKDGQTVSKDKDGTYWKEYPNGDKVKIDPKTDGDAIAAIEQVNGLVIEQRKHALAAMAGQMADAKNRGDRTVEGPDGIAVFRVTKEGDVIGKSSKEHGAFVKMHDGGMYRVKDGQVYTMQDGKETLVTGELPAGMKRNPNGSITVDSVTLSKDNKYDDNCHHQHMDNLTAKTTAETPNGPVVASVENGKESVHTRDRDYVFDSTKGPAGDFTVTNSNGTRDLDFNYNTHVLDTDGVKWGPSGLDFGDGACFIGNDDSITDFSGHDVFSDIAESSYAAYTAERDEEQTTKEEEKAEAVSAAAVDEIADVGGELSAGTIDYADVGDLNHDLASLTRIAGMSNLDATTKAAVERAIGQVSTELPLAERQAQASELAQKLAGGPNPELTKAIMDGGAVDPILKRWGLLPMEIFDQETKVA